LETPYVKHGEKYAASFLIVVFGVCRPSTLASVHERTSAPDHNLKIKIPSLCSERRRANIVLGGRWGFSETRGCQQTT